ncbi:MAG: sulfur carrier protein ThiS [Gammaproteobacteria bacterium]|nr:sulfur carrier protein ThiS [Gammaproteobacteria bacterium]NNJ92397.1 sulfur carrier protein ThiS [Gammaproteobacteria bacterium]
MNIQLNGQPKEVADNITITALLESMELYGRRIAVEVNEELVTRSQFGSHQLKENDVIEIVQAIGGG